MIVFIVTNNITQQVYVGTTQNSPAERWSKLKSAASLDIDAPIYHDIRQYGGDNFTLQDWGFASDREELRELISQAINDFDAITLQGVKTSRPIQKTQATDKKIRKTHKASANTIHAPRNKTNTATPTTTATDKLKIASGRVSSSSKEKVIREGIAKEKAKRQAEQQAKIAAEADEMKAIMARMDARASTMGRKR